MTAPFLVPKEERSTSSRRRESRVHPSRLGRLPVLQSTDRSILKRISGIGKPEQLRHALSGARSRRITADQIGRRRRHGSRGGRPVALNGNRYRDPEGRRASVDQLENCRGVPPTDDKHVLTCRGGVVVGAVLMWLEGTGPRRRQTPAGPG